MFIRDWVTRFAQAKGGGGDAESPGEPRVVPEGAVEAEGLTRRFGDFVAVDDVNLRVPRGSIFGFLGPSGSGKTTTMRMLCGLLRPTAGQAVVNGCDIERDPE